MWSRASLLLASLVACGRPDVIVVCHNGNCTGTTGPEADSTPAALRASLALRRDGVPVIDGVELDTLWHRSTATCLYAHGPGDQLPPDTAAEAAAIVADHLAGPEVAWNRERFYLFIELKGYVAGRFDLHTPAERDAHADCALDVYQRAVAGNAGRHRLHVVFESSRPELLEALIARPGWPGHLEGDVEVRLAGEAGPLWEALLWDEPLSAYRLPLDVMEYQAGWLTDAREETYRSVGLDLCVWSYADSQQTFAELRSGTPRYVLTSEAPLIRDWLDD